MSPEPPPQEEQPPLSDDEFLSLPQFNQTFTLQPTPENGLTGPFTLSYASIGDSSSQNVLLFFAPLMGSRLLHTPKHALASKLNLHILAVDRPGVGGTSPAAAPLRLGIMRVAIPALLSHLGISHVSIAAHSGGTIYALDFALENGDFLFGGYIALGCPWILPSRTGSAMLNVVGMLPKGMILQTGTLARFIATKAGPAMGMGYAAVGKVVAASGGLVKVVSGSALTSSSDAVEGRERNEEFEFEERIWGRLIRKMFEEGVDGISEDAVLFMKKGEDSGWGEWGDYDVLVPRLVEGLRARGKKLRVDVFYGEKDHMIGNAGSKGSVWFDGCWTGGEYADVVEFQSKTAKGADHDSIWSMEWDVAREVMERVARKRGN
ncbi:hypothetical protein QBC34DRAFT_450777 [Podospora aff. communis PSN243]|uniref:AB hydrolase-1 domain-containing protein n=1 Tax=Podospora aff. communis PSN243 TaxID=3040156 RepID=A0AAV9GDN2_9PEZI|nr:hypothetical protein QBC34DRAFT_450777 [Podospora aff. communis PSN243]